MIDVPQATTHRERAMNQATIYKWIWRVDPRDHVGTFDVDQRLYDVGILADGKLSEHTFIAVAGTAGELPRLLREISCTDRYHGVNAATPAPRR
jgi:hypothetical protein